MKRPVLVSVMAIVTSLIGVLQAAVGGAILSQRNDAKFLADAEVTKSEATAVGSVLLVVGVLAVLAGIGLWRGSRAMRALVGLVELGQIAGGIYTVATVSSSSERSSGIGMIAGAIVVLYFLFGTEKSKQFFSRA